MLVLADRPHEIEGLLTCRHGDTVRQVQQEHHVGPLRYLRQTESHETSYNEGKHGQAHAKKQASSERRETARRTVQPVPKKRPKDAKSSKIRPQGTYLPAHSLPHARYRQRTGQRTYPVRAHATLIVRGLI